MVENGGGEAVRKSRGRPQLRSDGETRALILKAAAQEFLAKGYGGTSIAAVAARAGVSTRTLYKFIPTKADLFESMISDRITRFVVEGDLQDCDAPTAATAIERMLTAYGRFAFEPRTVGLMRLVMGDCRAFPEVGTAFYEAAIQRTSQAMEDGIRRLCKRGLIALDDPREATSMLRGMMIMDVQRAAMLGQGAPPAREQIAARARRCAQLFLNGCAVRPQTFATATAPAAASNP
jgi:AcrR family transcriptional regulator